MGRGVATYIAAFVSGIIISKYTSCYACILTIFISFASSLFLFALLLLKKKHYGSYPFIATAHIILFLTGFSHYMIYNEYSCLPQRENNPVLRSSIEEKIKEMIPSPEERATLAAITLGDKSGIPPELKKAYGNSGAMHILALSGLHMGIIYGFINMLLAFLNITYKTKLLRLLFSAAVISLYGYMTGFPPSVQRAIIMIGIYNILKLSGRENRKYNVIAAAALLILIINPGQLFSISFQLSFAAVTGIAAFFPVIDACFSYLYPDTRRQYAALLPVTAKRFIRKTARAAWSITAISVSCQIATLPFTLFYFGSFPPFFLITNLAAIPVASATLYIFIPALILHNVPVIGPLAGAILYGLLKLLNSIIEFIG